MEDSKASGKYWAKIVLCVALNISVVCAHTVPRVCFSIVVACDNNVIALLVVLLYCFISAGLNHIPLKICHSLLCKFPCSESNKSPVITKSAHI